MPEDVEGKPSSKERQKWLTYVEQRPDLELQSSRVQAILDLLAELRAECPGTEEHYNS